LALQVQSLLQSLHSKDTPRQIALGFAVGSLAGWAPFNVLYSSFILLLLYVLNVNTGFGIIAIGVVSIFSYFLDPLAGIIGKWLLVDVSFLQPLWGVLYNIPIFPYTRFNNTVMLGSVALGLVLFFPVYFLIRWCVLRYRSSWYERLEKSKVMRVVKGSKLVTWYMRVKE
jgi:uncharacterized protein (TIGR03546 family)